MYARIVHFPTDLSCELFSVPVYMDDAGLMYAQTRLVPTSTTWKVLRPTAPALIEAVVLIGSRSRSDPIIVHLSPATT